MINMLKYLHQEESGQDLIEYGLIALIVALGALAGMWHLGEINQRFVRHRRRRTHLTETLPVGSRLCGRRAGDCWPHLRKSQQKRAWPGVSQRPKAGLAACFLQSDSSRLQCTTILIFLAISRGHAIAAIY